MEGRTLGGRYRLVEPLGSGGMAAVWAAEDLELERRVAVKLLAPDADRARFEREARLLAAVAHPNVVRLFDFGEDDGTPYMVLELLPGGTLEERLVGGQPLPDNDTGRIAVEIAAGLAAAHAQELVHRDLKPSNVLFDGEGRAKLADFGIARSADAGTLTEPGTVLGTASYISPEQAAGEPATPASDVYSFGVILYRILAGRLPFESRSATELVQAHLREDPQPISDVRADAPPDLARVALAALAKDPAARPRDGGLLLDELRQPVATSAMPPAPETTAVIAPPPRRPVSRAAAIVIALLVLAGAGAALALVAWQGEDAPAAPKAPDRPRTGPAGAETVDAPPPPTSEPTTDATTATAQTGSATTETVPTTDTLPTEPIPTVDTSVATTTEPPIEPPPPITTETTGTGPSVP